MANGPNYMRQLEPDLLPALNAFLSNHGPKLGSAGAARPGSFTARYTNDTIEILGMPPFVTPHLGVFHDSSGDYLRGGLIPPGKDKEPLPPELIREINAHNNLICYGWEFTGGRLLDWRGLFQLGQLMFNFGAPGTGTAASKWIQAIVPKMATSGTEVSLTAPDEVLVLRNSTIGLTAFELSGLAYWLDSPGFPLSAHREPPRWRSAPAGSPIHQP